MWNIISSPFPTSVVGYWSSFSLDGSMFEFIQSILLLEVAEIQQKMLYFQYNKQHWTYTPRFFHFQQEIRKIARSFLEIYLCPYLVKKIKMVANKNREIGAQCIYLLDQLVNSPNLAHAQGFPGSEVVFLTIEIF